MNRNYTAKWTQEHRFFQGGGACKVHMLENLLVVQAAYIKRTEPGWAFTYTTEFGKVEKHFGFRTMRDAKAAAVLYATSPVGTPIPR